MRKSLTLCLLMMLSTLAAVAQPSRTSYFMESSQYRMKLNPALTPSRGFVNIPVGGYANAAYESGTIDFDDAWEIIHNEPDADYFTSKNFMSKLKDDNHLTAAATDDILSAGWYHGRNFWSFEIGARVDAGAGIPLSAFQFLREMKGMESVDYSNYLRHFGKEELNINAYAYAGVGYARQLNDVVTIGGRVKALLGMGNVKFKVNDAVIQTNMENVDPDVDWTHLDYTKVMNAQGTAMVDVDAELEYTAKGVELLTNEDGYINDVEFDRKKLGVAGIGAAFDAGIALQLTRGFQLSAAINDLGFIKWSKKNNKTAHSMIQNRQFSSEDPEGMLKFAELVGNSRTLNYDLMQMAWDEGESKDRSTNINSTLALGASYTLPGDQVKFGLLYTNYLAMVKSQSEITMAFNWHPSSLVDIGLSYSPILCGGRSFGVALKVGPIFLGTDYMYLRDDTKTCNAYVGLSIPLHERPVY